MHTILKARRKKVSGFELIFCVVDFQYVEMQEEELDSKDRLIAVEAARISQFYNLLTSSIDVISKFCDKIPGYNELCKEDRELLFRSACLELFTLRLSHRSVQIKSCCDNHKFHGRLELLLDQIHNKFFAKNQILMIKFRARSSEGPTTCN